MKKIGLIHTTPLTIDSLTQLIKNEMTGIKIYHLLDETMLEDMINQTDVEFVRKRWIQYAKNLELRGMDLIMSACSTVGEFADEANGLLKIPVLRIDDAMAEKAVNEGKRIQILSTLESTLIPTQRLIEKKAHANGKKVVIKAYRIPNAFDAASNGDKELHNKLVKEAIESSKKDNDIIVLAQASMAGAIANEVEDSVPILTSPKLAIVALKKEIESL